MSNMIARIRQSQLFRNGNGLAAGGFLLVLLLAFYKTSVPGTSLMASLRGSFLLSYGLFLLFLMILRLRPVIIARAVGAGCAALILLATVNQLVSPLMPYVSTMTQQIMAFIIPCSSLIIIDILMGFSRGRQILSIMIYAISLLVLMAFFQKLETGPDLQPFFLENTALWTPLVYGVGALLLAQLLTKHQQNV